MGDTSEATDEVKGDRSDPAPSPFLPLPHSPSLMPKLTLSDLDLQNGQRVLVRVDFNVPLSNGEVGDDTRIRAALPTIRQITEAGAVAVLMSHLGRPKGEPDPELSLRPVAEHLSDLLDADVRFVEETVGEKAEQAVEQAEAGDVVLLENTRFQPGEKKNDDAFAKKLAALADVYVNDAFGAAHRAHASTEGVTRHVEKAAMGLLIAKEVEALSRLLERPEKPFVAALGGAKVSDKLGVIEALLGKVDGLLIGGAMSYTFLKALGEEVGASRAEDDRLEEAKNLYDRADGRIQLPSDHVVADELSESAEAETVSGAIPEGKMGLDIGPETMEAYREALQGAQTVVWNGPMGVFEIEPFAEGTRRMAEALAEATEAGAYTVVGGGDSVAAITESGFADRISHVSTGGGAMLEFLEGKTLPGIAALTDAS